ncbi:MAG: cell filamentation protein Fic, partial [Gammaproteobacteria bacterium]
MEERFGDNWSLSPEQSLTIHAENWNVPEQLLVRAKRGDNKPITLPHNTSLFNLRSSLPHPDQSTTNQGLRLFSLPAALIATNSATYRQHPTDMRVALAIIQDASEVLSLLLDGGHSKVAGRLAGAFRNIGKEK